MAGATRQGSPGENVGGGARLENKNMLVLLQTGLLFAGVYERVGMKVEHGWVAHEDLIAVRV